MEKKDSAVGPNKNESDEFLVAKKWYATKEEISDDFEDARRFLLQSYATSIQTHVGIVIALIIGLGAFTSGVIAGLDTLLKIIGLYGTIGVLLGAIVLFGVFASWMRIRILYWTLWQNIGMGIPMYSVIRYFNEANKSIFEKTSNETIIEIAICQEIKRKKLKNEFPRWYKRLVVSSIK
jgi:hypothetical protein